ncbi:MAG: hypothetical protein AAF772_20255, partial [Acidobacteriota bacterium]
MTPERWRQIDALFHDALAQPAAARAAFLADACGDDDALRAEVESLLAADADLGEADDGMTDAVGRGLAPAASDLAMDDADLNDASSDDDGPAPETIGPYRIVQLLGRGGMGTVYLGVRDDLGLRAAVKRVRPGLDAGGDWLRRLRREQRILARL